MANKLFKMENPIKNRFATSHFSGTKDEATFLRRKEIREKREKGVRGNAEVAQNDEKIGKKGAIKMPESYTAARSAKNLDDALIIFRKASQRNEKFVDAEGNSLTEEDSRNARVVARKIEQGEKITHAELDELYKMPVLLDLIRKEYGDGTNEKLTPVK